MSGVVERNLSGQHALITGAGTGIGAAIAQSLFAAGARVTLAGRRLDILQACAQRIGAPADACVVMDVTDENSVAAGIARATATAGAVEILVNNAGSAVSAPFLGTDAAALDAMLAVNFKGPWRLTQAVLPGMIARRSGRIITIASTAGVKGYAYVTAYAAAKHAVIGMTRALALEVALHGITVNAVCPGFADTPLVVAAVNTIAAKTGRSLQASRDDLARGNPMGRLVQPREVADAVVWLASPGAAAINGQAIVVAGGEI